MDVEYTGKVIMKTKWSTKTKMAKFNTFRIGEINEAYALFIESSRAHGSKNYYRYPNIIPYSDVSITMDRRL